MSMDWWFERNTQLGMDGLYWHPPNRQAKLSSDLSLSHVAPPPNGSLWYPVVGFTPVSEQSNDDESITESNAPLTEMAFHTSNSTCLSEVFQLPSQDYEPDSHSTSCDMSVDSQVQQEADFNSESTDSEGSTQSALSNNKKDSLVHPQNSKTVKMSTSKDPAAKLRTASRKSKNRLSNTAAKEARIPAELLQLRESHNMVEKRYRDRLNTCFEDLLAVLTLRAKKSDDNFTHGHCVSRGKVLNCARQRIISLERDNERLTKERDQLLMDAALTKEFTLRH